MITSDQAKPGTRVKSVCEVASSSDKTVRTVTHTGVVLGLDTGDWSEDRALVRYDGFGGHVSHPLLSILEILSS